MRKPTKTVWVGWDGDGIPIDVATRRAYLWREGREYAACTKYTLVETKNRKAKRR